MFIGELADDIWIPSSYFSEDSYPFQVFDFYLKLGGVLEGGLSLFSLATQRFLNNEGGQRSILCLLENTKRMKLVTK